MVSSGLRMVYILVSVAFALYLANFKMGFVKISDSFKIVNDWVLFAAAIFIIIGAISFMRATSYRYGRY